MFNGVGTAPNIYGEGAVMYVYSGEPSRKDTDMNIAVSIGSRSIAVSIRGRNITIRIAISIWSRNITVSIRCSNITVSIWYRNVLERKQLGNTGNNNLNITRR